MVEIIIALAARHVQQFSLCISLCVVAVLFSFDPANCDLQPTTWEWMHSSSSQEQVTWPLYFRAAALIVQSLHLRPRHL